MRHTPPSFLGVLAAVCLTATGDNATAAPAVKEPPRAAHTAEGDLSVIWSLNAPLEANKIWIAGERVVVAAGGQLRGIDRSAGRLVWEVKRRAKILSGGVIGSHFVFVDDKGRMAAYRIEDGRVTWSEPGESGKKRKAPAGPASFLALPGGKEFIAVEASRVTRRTTEGGRIVWSQALPVSNRSGAGIQDAALILPAGRSLVAYSLDTGEPLWGEDLGGVSYVSRLTEGGEAAIVATERDLLVRIDSATGRRVWQAEQAVALRRSLPASGADRPMPLIHLERAGMRAREEAEPAGAGLLQLDGARAYVAGSDFTARAYDLSTGARVWSLPLRGSATLHRVAALVCVQGTSPGLQCLDRESGRKVWESPEEVEQTLPLAGGVLAAAHGAEIRLLHGGDGRTLGRARLEQRVISLHASPDPVAGTDLLLARTRGRLVALRAR
jgi:outer membrane protein assembly factor BamB